jgi:ketosteroid isomerase-like protein
MNKFILLAVMACMGGITYAQSPLDRSIESKLAALEHLLRVQAFSSKDLHTVEMLLSRDFVMVNEEAAPKNRDESLAYLQSLGTLRYVAEEMIVRVHGDTAVVTGLFEMTGVQNGKAFVRRGRFLDTWLVKDDTWLLMASISIPAA